MFKNYFPILCWKTTRNLGIWNCAPRDKSSPTVITKHVMARFHNPELKWEACSGCRRTKGKLKGLWRMATLIHTGCHSHGDPAHKWLSPGQGTKSNFSICRKGSASAPEITKLFLPFLALRRVYSPWAFRYASGMPQECTYNTPEQKMTEKQRQCYSLGLVLFVLQLRIPKIWCVQPQVRL